MPLRETTVARLGLVGLAIALWRTAGPLVFDGLLPHHPFAVALLALTYASSFVALLVATSTSERVEKLATCAIGAFALAAVVYAFRDGLRKTSADFYPTTDGHVFMETAARYLLSGKNPYAMGLAEGFRTYRLPLSHVTPLLDGDFSDRQAYPPLSFLVLVPALLAHVPTYTVYAAAFLAAVAITVQKAPWWTRPLIVALFVLDESYFSFSFGGVTDTVWVLLVVGAIVWWRSRPTAAAVLIGLACAYKQHPWFLVPFLVLRIAHESGERPWGRTALRFVAVVGGVFTLVNLPFVLLGPHRWLLGITEPLSAPMVQLSEGLTAFSMTGWIVMPRKGTTLIFWSTYALMLLAYARHPRTLRDWSWVVPAVVLWFGYRALMSYWYFFAVMAIAAMASREEGGDDREDVTWRPELIGAGVLVGAIGLFMAWCGTRAAPFDVALAGPLEAWDRRVFVARIKVTNRLGRTVFPQFWAQSSGQQPLPWVIDYGPHELLAGKSADYIIRASHHFKEFDAVEGARLEVHDRVDPGQRSFLSIPGVPTLRSPDAIPNPDFRVVETRTRVPSGWSFESSVARLAVVATTETPARIGIEFGPNVTPPPPSPLAACVVPQHVGGVEVGARKATLSTVLPLPEGRLTFDVNIPSDANRPPYEKIYGVSLDVSGFHALVLFGDEVERGNLPSGELFVGVQAARGSWTKVSFEPRALLERLKAPLLMRRYPYLRAPALDFPSIPLEIGLVATAPPTGAVRVEFGHIDQASFDDYDAIAKRPSPPGLDTWRAELDLENGNFWKAWTRLEEVNAVEPTTDRLVKQGDAYLAGYEYAKARDVYARAAGAGGVPEAESGLGFALLGLEDYDGAKLHLERARDTYKEWEKAPPRFRYVTALRGLVRVHARKHECAEAARIRDEMMAEMPAAPPVTIDPCP